MISYDGGVRLTRSARKHGLTADEVRRVLDAPLRSVRQPSAHGEVVLHIGVTDRRDLVEVVVAPGDPPVVLHAMRLRPANYPHLTGVTSHGEPARKG
ncbi:hypothetical protein [Pseudonocardia broussonetiae]|uniref:DUF4258 domain-containing protein n=1 Tax=Pseudonocardia broussonetiae TaxID=2736640 RepID=A0A6M6JPR1_9PSEU|nr:hypothetical protein [Pseudonocardia broussonetiae]QJY49276.1 hypothetical protein HOP40_28875 [Pseudonocardia broussonetiae]